VHATSEENQPTQMKEHQHVEPEWAQRLNLRSKFNIVDMEENFEKTKKFVISSETPDCDDEIIYKTTMKEHRTIDYAAERNNDAESFA